jgi:hypothetical protein
MAGLDKGVEQEAVAKKVIGSTEVQNRPEWVGMNTEKFWAVNIFVNLF